MIFGEWRQWLNNLSRNTRGSAASRKRARSARPGLEVLEGREVPAALFVDNLGDFEITSDHGTVGVLDNGDEVTWTPGAGNGPVQNLIFGTSAFDSIQAAINAAAAGDTVYVGSGTFVEQLEINKTLDVIEAEGHNAVIKSPASLALGFNTSASNKPVIYVHDADGVTLRGLTVDGDGQGNSNYRFIGIAYYNAGGTINGVEVKNIRHTPFNGVQGGTGIYGYANDAASPHTLKVMNSFVHDYQKNGITMSGVGLTANVTGNTITGAGPTNQIAQNGIQFSLGAAGTIAGNTVSGHRYANPNVATSTGILLYDVGRVALTDNIVTDGQTGIYAYQADGLTIQGGEVREQTLAILLYGADGARVNGVTISNSSALADSMGVDVYQSTNVTISDTTISGHTNGVYVEGGGSASVDNNRITANGTGIQVIDGGSLTSVTENFITGNTGDGILITATAGSVAPVFNNDLSGNGGLAVNNQSATMVNAAGNWWGTRTIDGVAGVIGGNVDFMPFQVTGKDTSSESGFQGDANMAPGQGSVRVKVIGGRLMITGDNLNNRILVEKLTDANSYRVTGLNGTQINGQLEWAGEVFENVTRGIDANLKGGDDSLVLDGSASPDTEFGTIKVRTGRGDDLVRLQDVTTAKADLGSSWGSDFIQLIDSSFNTLAVDWIGNGASTSLELDGVTVTGQTKVRGGNGDDSILAFDSNLAGVLIQTGRGSDTVRLEGVDAKGRVQVETGRGKDLVAVSGSSFDAAVVLDGGGEVDELDAGMLLLGGPNTKGNTFSGEVDPVGRSF